MTTHCHRFTSFLDCGYKKALEQIVFLNGNQIRILAGALHMIEHYGTPRISNAGNRLWITFDSGVETQSLFVLEQSSKESRLIGVVVYTRENDMLAVILLAIHEDYTCDELKADQNLCFSILNEVHRIAHRIKGISSIKLFLTNPPLVIPVAGVTQSLN